MSAEPELSVRGFVKYFDRAENCLGMDFTRVSGNGGTSTLDQA
jgi:hypothetical protein